MGWCRNNIIDEVVGIVAVGGHSAGDSLCIKNHRWQRADGLIIRDTDGVDIDLVPQRCCCIFAIDVITAHNAPAGDGAFGPRQKDFAVVAHFVLHNARVIALGAGDCARRRNHPYISWSIIDAGFTQTGWCGDVGRGTICTNDDTTNQCGGAGIVDIVCVAATQIGRTDMGITQAHLLGEHGYALHRSTRLDERAGLGNRP